MEELSIFEAAHILGTTPAEAKELLKGHDLTSESVEDVALDHYRWRAHVDNVDSYWVTVKQAAVIHDVSTQRVKQLLVKDLLPYVTTHTGVRLMRRQQLETVASARLARRLQRG